MEITGKIISFKKTKKGAVAVFTDNPEEAGEPTFKHVTHKVERNISDTFDNQLRTLLGHALIFLNLDNKKLTEKEMKSRKSVDMAAFKIFKVTGFTIIGDGEDEKVKINLEIHTDRGDVAPLVTPAIALVDEGYEYCDLLAQDMDDVIAEVHKYLDGNNYYVQGDLFKQEEEQETKDGFKQF